MAPPVKLDQAKCPGLGVTLRRLNNQGDLNIANIAGGVGRGHAARRPNNDGVKRVIENGNWIAAWIQSLYLSDLGGSSVIHHVLNVRNQHAWRSKRRNRINTLGDNSAPKHGSLQLIAYPPDDACAVVIFLEDHVKVARGGTCSAPRSAHDTGSVGRVTGIPGNRRLRIIGRGGHDGEMVLRRVPCVADIAHDLIQSQARFLKRVKDLRFGLAALLGHAQETKHRSADDDKYRHRYHQLDERESCLFLADRREVHFSTMVSRFTGSKGALPPDRRTPMMKRLPALFANV